jgi:hypothetical protein
MARATDRFVEGVREDILFDEGMRGPCMHNYSTSCVRPEDAAFCTAEGDRHFWIRENLCGVFETRADDSIFQRARSSSRLFFPEITSPSDS